jgi:hypothetical protein
VRSLQNYLASLFRDLASCLDGNTAFVIEHGAKFSTTIIGQGGRGGTGLRPGVHGPYGGGGPSSVTIASSTDASGVAEQIAAAERGMRLAGVRKDGGSMRGSAWQAWRAEQDVCQHLDMRQYCEHCHPVEEGIRTSVGVGFPRPGCWWIRSSKANPGYIEVQLSLADSGKWISVLLGVASWHAMKEAGDEQMEIADGLTKL